MAVTLDLISSTPSQSVYGLDKLTYRYKTNSSWVEVLLDASLPQLGDALVGAPFMFLTDRHLTESGASSCAFDLVYQGAFKSVSGNPVLPPSKSEEDDALQSASSKRSSAGTILTDPAVLQYYAPTSLLSYISYGGPGVLVAPDPAHDPRAITLTVGDTALSIGGTVEAIINGLFMVQLIVTPKSQEIVPGQYWQNTCRKTKIFTPWIFDVPSGPFLSLYSPGNGYTIGDTLTVSAGGESATVVLTSVGGFQGTGILDWTVSSNTFTVPHNSLPASGGTGDGAGFNVIIIP